MGKTLKDGRKPATKFRGPQKAPLKILRTFRLSVDVVDFLDKNGERGHNKTSIIEHAIRSTFFKDGNGVLL